jgi:hypothetical protein
MATRYYACFAKYAGFQRIVTAVNSRPCPDAQEYFGSIVNGVAPNVLIGAYRFPNDGELTELDASAEVSFARSPFSLEPIMFGKWPDPTPR